MECAVKYGTWKISQYDKNAKEALQQAGYSPLTARVLCSRGYTTPELAQQFLSAAEPLEDPLSMRDMAAAAEVLKGRHLAKGVRGIVIPATETVYRECMHRGYTDIFLDAGCIVSTPTCGPCLGGYMGILAQGERCIATTNRNFVGRMGHVDSEVYLASPATAAASALTGYITAPKEV